MADYQKLVRKFQADNLACFYYLFSKNGFTDDLLEAIDNTNAFTSAIKLANELKKNIYIPAGTYIISNDLPEYVLTKQEGPPHKRTFYVDVYFRGEFLASGVGMSKKDAQKEAAHKACKKLGLIEDKEKENV